MRRTSFGPPVPDGESTAEEAPRASLAVGAFRRRACGRTGLRRLLRFLCLRRFLRLARFLLHPLGALDEAGYPDHKEEGRRHKCGADGYREGAAHRPARSFELVDVHEGEDDHQQAGNHSGVERDD